MKDKLLVIELDEYGSVPRVFYKGEKIKGKVRVLFDWHTKDDKHFGLPHIEIEYGDYENGSLVCKAIKLSNPFKESEPQTYEMKERMLGYQRMLETGLLTINEIRIREGLPPIPDGNVLYQPLQVTSRKDEKR